MVRSPGAKAAIELLLVDDHELLLRGLESFIRNEAPDIRIVGKAKSAEEGCRLSDELVPDVVLLDLDLGGPNELSVLARLVKRGRPRVLVYTAVRDSDVHREAILLGARGVLVKATDPSIMLKAIRCVAAGELWLDRVSTGELLTRLMNDRPPVVTAIGDSRIANLTRREREIMAIVCSDPARPTKRVASQLNISEHTLRNHLSTIYRKLGVDTRAELRSVAQKGKLIAPRS
jgi:DNA-binding NarL/FixJ family response regulator